MTIINVTDPSEINAYIESGNADRAIVNRVTRNADLIKAGTQTLFDIVPEINPPLDSTAEDSPKLIEELAPNEKVPIQISLSPGPKAGVGEYEVVIDAKGQTGNEEVEAFEKRLRVRISAEANITATLILVLGLVVLITGIVFMGVKLSRR